jgi:hypothetical protein
MARFEVTLRDRTTEEVGDADAYQQEGPMTTFFRTGDGGRVDSWSTRVASVRTADVLLIRRASAELGGESAALATHSPPSSIRAVG